MTARSAAIQIGGGVASGALALALLQVAAASVTAAAPRGQPSPAAAAGISTVDPPPPAAAPTVASYTLTARLDAQSHTVTARGTIRWKNTSSQPTSELWLHLYLNAFKNDRTLFLRSPFGAGRSGNRARDWGYLDVKRLSARELDHADLWPTAARHSPGDPHDETDIRVPLPAPVEPNQTLTLDVEFEAKLPQIVERTGYSGSFHFVAQWFPKLARRLPDGTWAHFPFHPQSEFFSDFGTYSVTLDVPESMRVGATGVRVEERVSQGRRVVRHQARGVHDFAWTAWDRFEERKELIDGVQVRLLYPPGHAHNAELSAESLRFALPHFSTHYGRYPYSVLTVVHPPEHARSAGGMEYPTLITTGGPWYAGYLVRAIEAVTVHELAHQWFYGLVATDEHAWPFLDEGLTSFAEGVALRERYGAGSLVDLPGLQIGMDEIQRYHAISHGHDERIALPAAEFPGFRSLGALAYARTATVLRTLANVYSEQSVLRALGRYARQHRFAHPGPEDLLAAVHEEVGSDAADLLRIALFERGWVDYRVSALSNAKRTPPGGVFDSDGGRQTRERQPAGSSAQWVGQATVVRRGSLQLPVNIELIAEDGSRTIHSWDGQGSWITVEQVGDSPVVRAVVDADHLIALDENFLNNAVSAQPQPGRRATERATYLAQLLLGWLGP